MDRVAAEGQQEGGSDHKYVHGDDDENDGPAHPTGGKSKECQSKGCLAGNTCNHGHQLNPGPDVVYVGIVLSRDVDRVITITGSDHGNRQTAAGREKTLMQPLLLVL